MPENPFGDEPRAGARPPNPFGDEPVRETPSGDPVAAIEHAAARLRRLKSLAGSEGLTLSGTRELLDQISTGFDAIARALREIRPPG